MQTGIVAAIKARAVMGGVPKARHAKRRKPFDLRRSAYVHINTLPLDLGQDHFAPLDQRLQVFDT